MRLERCHPRQRAFHLVQEVRGSITPRSIDMQAPVLAPQAEDDVVGPVAGVVVVVDDRHPLDQIVCVERQRRHHQPIERAETAAATGASVMKPARGREHVAPRIATTRSAAATMLPTVHGNAVNVIAIVSQFDRRRGRTSDSRFRVVATGFISTQDG